jgi:hypothetical protein
MPASESHAARAAARVFGAAAARRRARALHPAGAAFTATLEVTGGAGTGVPLLDRPARFGALVRFSRAAGTPRPLPDGLGLALRVPDVDGPGRHQDVLLTTSIDLPVVHHLVLPTIGGFFGQSYTSAFPYRTRSGLLLLGARPVRRRRGADLPELRAAAAAGDAAFELCVARPLGRWRGVGRIEPGVALGAADEPALAFDPLNDGGGLHLVPALLAVRHAAYRASQARRPGAPLPDSAA